MRVLLIDDTPDNRKILSAFLRAEGHEVTLGASGEEAIDLFSPGTFDVVFLDLMMPGLDGFETLRRLQQLDPENTTPVVALTAHALPEDVDRCAAAGFDGHLAKPVTRKQLLASVDEHQRPRAAFEPDDDPLVNAAIAELLPDYVERRREDVTSLRDAVQRGDLDTVRMVGHRMAGSGSTYGLPEVSEIGRALESAALERTPGVVGDLLQRLEAELARIGPRVGVPAAG